MVKKNEMQATYRIQPKADKHLGFINSFCKNLLVGASVIHCCCVQSGVLGFQ